MSDDNNTAEKILAEEGLLEPFSGDPNSLDNDRIQSLLDAPPVVSTDLECSKCHGTTRVICPTCKGPFCELHTAILDGRYCSSCLSEPMAEIKILPLVSSDGVSHDGRELKPTGPAFGTLSKRIFDMSDSELEAHIQYYQELVRQAEKSLDFRRVVLGASQIESAQRKDAQLRHLRASGYKPPKRITSTDGKITIKAGSGNKVDPAKSLAGALGVSGDALAAILAVLTAKENKK